ncbi:uncharacterized protein [Leptinotarsa decemlineata]|uniref:uncharacterized protein n=1 Tax=Leptinotarsa decemlineata TaxID=7539 RepID=UPI003D304181
MSRRRNPRRAAAASRNLRVDSEENSSDEDLDLLEILKDLLQSRRKIPKKRTPKKSKQSSSGNKKSSGAGRKQQTGASATVTSTVSSEFDCEPIDEDVKVNQLKNIESKVNNFFNSGNLLSDDDELDIAKSNVAQPPKESKEFYSLTDSDEDKPSTSKLDRKDTISSLGSTLTNEPVTVEQSKNNDELMDIVDKILDGNEPIEVDTEPDKNWDEYKTKTEEILGSMNAILDEFKENVEKEKPEEKVVEKSPQKEKPTCPICLEVLGGDVVAAATLCGHIFCHECLKKVAKTSKTCPTCRKRINCKQIHPLYI